MASGTMLSRIDGQKVIGECFGRRLLKEANPSRRSGTPVALFSLQHVAGGVIVRHSIVAIGLLSLVFLTLLAVPKGQALEAISPSLTFTAVQGGSNPVSQAVSFLKTNTRKSNWVTSSNAAWLSLTLSSANPSDQLLVGVNVAGLPAGVYTGTVSITGMKDERISIPVTLTINTRTLVRVSPSPSSPTTTTTFSLASSTTD